jgi:hypothetical protein
VGLSVIMTEWHPLRLEYRHEQREEYVKKKGEDSKSRREASKLSHFCPKPCSWASVVQVTSPVVFVTVTLTNKYKVHELRNCEEVRNRT